MKVSEGNTYEGMYWKEMIPKWGATFRHFQIMTWGPTVYKSIIKVSERNTYEGMYWGEMIPKWGATFRHY